MVGEQVVAAYAKLNLALRVHGRRPDIRRDDIRRDDDFHEIVSLVQTIDLADTVIVERIASGVDLSNDLGIPPEEDLAARAAHLLLQEKGRREGMRIEVKKKIPSGAGLGGGSSDAAAVLLAVDRLTPPILPPDRLSALAARLGSDVPLFLTGGLVRITGRGERVAAIHPIRTEHFIVLVPPIHCATAAVYEYFDSCGAGSGEGERDLSLGENDLKGPALALYPSLLPYSRAIDRLGADYSGMSGSGSAFFAAFARFERAAEVQEELAASFPETRVYFCRATVSGQGFGF